MTIHRQKTSAVAFCAGTITCFIDICCLALEFRFLIFQSFLFFQTRTACFVFAFVELEAISLKLNLLVDLP